jgi:putative NIF3 family GTP cyclohydrolase 1 type 2
MRPRCLVAAFLALSATLALPGTAQSKRITARQVIERIQKNVGVPWKEPTVDTFKTGDPDAPVTGVAVTMMTTLEVLQRVAASGKNLVITHEPTFYHHNDPTEDLEKEGDKVFAAKQAFIKQHGLIIWRFHDHWHARSPDGVLTGMARTLDWQKYQVRPDDQVFTLPETSLNALAADLKKRLKIRTLRVVGDANLKVTKAALAPGFGPWVMHRRLLQRDDVEVLVIGEAHEWETIEYVADAAAAKQRKALIVLGHVPSENGGMDECARWLRTFVPEVPIEYVPTREPFWAPR